MFQSLEDNIPQNKEEIILWIKEAHNLINNWFFKMIAGELIRRFE